MSREPTPEVINGETRLVFSHARTGELIHEAWPETAFTAIPDEGDRVSLVLSQGQPNTEGEWMVEESDSVVVIIKDLEYRYNWVHFVDEDQGVDVQRLLTDVFIRAEPLEAVEESE